MSRPGLVARIPWRHSVGLVRCWVLVAALGLTAVACGRAVPPGAEGDAAEPLPPASESLPVVPLIVLRDDPVLIAFEGETPPIWSLDYEESETILWWIFGMWGSAPDGTPEECVERVPERGYDLSQHARDCMERVFASRGLSEEAVGLFWRSHLTIFSVEGPGPVWVGETMDWDLYDTNGTNADTIVVPGGVLEIGAQWEWRAWSEASDEARSMEVFGRIEEAVAPDVNTPWGEPGPPLVFGAFGSQTTELGVPAPYADGWAVPVTSRLAGCHACITDFAGRFSFDFSATGVPLGVRFLGWCAYPLSDWREWKNQEQVASLVAELAPCSQPPVL